MTFIHKTAEVSKGSRVGKNCSIWNEAQVREDVIIGNNCIIGKGVYIDANCEIGNNVKIQNYACIYEKVVIRDGVFVGPYVCFANDKYPRAINNNGTIKKESDWSKFTTIVKYGASIGAGAIILPGITIEEYTMIASGSIVTKDTLPHALIIGNPGVLSGYVCICGAVLTKSKRMPRVLLCKKCQKENLSP